MKFEGKRVSDYKRFVIRKRKSETWITNKEAGKKNIEKPSKLNEMSEVKRNRKEKRKNK